MKHTRVLFTVLRAVKILGLPGLFHVISVKEPFFVGLISGSLNHGLEAKKS